jgi:hypothetical protein
MHISLLHDLPFVSVALTYRGLTAIVEDVLVDTGSGGTLVAADAVAALNLVPEPTDVLRTLRGVGGREVVFTRVVDRLRVGERALDQFLVEIGGMDYGFAINGILGMDFLTRSRAVIDFTRNEIEFPQG